LEEVLKIIAVVVATTIGFTIAGVAGFGGGIIGLPVLVWVFGVQEAIPILCMSQALSTISRAYLHRQTLNWPVARCFILGCLPFSVLGSFLFVSIDTEVLVRILGVTMLLFVVYARLPIGQNFKMKVWGFIPVGAGSGFGSAFLGIPGPFAAIFYLAYGLSASAYIGTSALGMAAIQVPKLIIYGTSDLLTLRVLLMGISLGAIAACSAYMGRIILRRIPEHVFPKIITTMLLISGVVFLIKG